MSGGPVRGIVVAGVLAAALFAQDPKATPAPPASVRMADGREWTARNLDIAVAPSWCYDNADSNCRGYGRLYSWESAQRACRSLGAGWRLPADDDWRRLAKRFGGVSQDAGDKGKAAFKALLAGGNSGFSAVLGGGRDEQGGYARLEAHGFYWTSSEDGPAGACYYNFAAGGQALHRQSGGEKQRGFSVRCVRD
jgi:uncharacterized protein (TIGR02145 family)